MTQPETDADYRARILKVCTEEDRGKIYLLYSKKLDEMGRKYDRFRFGVPLFNEEKDKSHA